MSQRHAFPSKAFQNTLLRWYDDHARALPWRARPGQIPNPYHVWLSEIMLQQTTVAAVGPYFQKFTQIWPDIHAFANANPERVMKEWAGLGYYARARNLIVCAQQITKEYEGVFPQEEAELLKLRGIGPYTAAAIAAIAFNKPAVVIDGNIERVTSRLFRIQKPLPISKPLIRHHAEDIFKNIKRSGDFAQSLMDLGATICTPQNPKCTNCPVRKFCAGFEKGDAARYPLKERKKKTPVREGKVFWLSKGSQIVCEIRDKDRMLGGMLGLPTTDWDLKHDEGSPFAQSLKMIDTGLSITHTFSHFKLTLKIYKANLKVLPKKNMKFISIHDILDSGLPSLFQKVARKMIAS